MSASVNTGQGAIRGEPPKAPPPLLITFLRSVSVPVWPSPSVSNMKVPAEKSRGGGCSTAPTTPSPFPVSPWQATQFTL